MKRFGILLLGGIFLLEPALAASVIFIHPDGAGVAAWQAARFLKAGPDGDLHWDRLPHLAIYRGHLADNLTATSNGGGTAHAYGVKVPAAAFGSDGKTPKPLVAASGEEGSLMHEAMRRGLRTALINSGSLVEPGTAAFVASVASRSEDEEIARQVVESGVDILMAGGEQWLLPEGLQGRHGQGRRRDGRNLIEEAKKAGYLVVYNREELAAVPVSTRKLLGVFAEGHTFHDMPQPEMEKKRLPTYVPSAPTLAEMLAKALDLLEGSHFFAVVEEEGSDNFGNVNNARGMMDALLRADEAIGVALDYAARHPSTVLFTASDSSAGNPDAIGFSAEDPGKLAAAAAGRDANGAPYGTDTGGKPFLSAPDAAGRQHPFVIAWSSRHDTSGGIAARASANLPLPPTVDNTAVYRLLRQALIQQN